LQTSASVQPGVTPFGADVLLQTLGVPEHVSTVQGLLSSHCAAPAHGFGPQTPVVGSQTCPDGHFTGGPGRHPLCGEHIEGPKQLTDGQAII
jgi:hypothetical protein